MRYTLGMIGCGNMGGALVRAASKVLPVGSITVCDHNVEKVDSLVEECDVVAASAKEIAASADIVVLGVKPKALSATIDEIRDVLIGRNDVVLVSMAAGVEIATIGTLVGADIPVIRMMPNTPVAVGSGIILYALSEGVSKDVESEFLRIFSAAGRIDRLSEGAIDAATAVAGCGPAFAYLFAEALADGGVECGLPRDKAALYAAEMLRGAAEMLVQYGHPADLKDAVCSPGGSTIAGVHALERGGFRASVMDAVTSAYDKTCQMK